eukprot:71659_1
MSDYGNKKYQIMDNDNTNVEIKQKSIHLTSNENIHKDAIKLNVQSVHDKLSSESILIEPQKTPNENQFHCCECMQYCIFIILFTITAILSRSSDSSNYQITSQLKQLLFTENINDHGPIFVDMVQESEMWDYMQTLLLPRLLIENTTSGIGSAITDEKNKYLVNTNNKLLAGIRIRSIRVAPTSCLIENDQFPNCYPNEFMGTQVTTSLSGFNEIPNIVYKTASENDDIMPWTGSLQMYGGGGYTIDLKLNLLNATNIVNDLRNGGFVSRSTRVVFIDFNTYNPMVNIHSVARLAFEYPAAGGVMASYDIKSWKIFRYKGMQGTAVLIMEAILVLFVIYFNVEELRDAKKYGCRLYLKNDKWNWVDI